LDFISKNENGFFLNIFWGENISFNKSVSEPDFEAQLSRGIDAYLTARVLSESSWLLR
jgi:hypothetical protein